MQNPEKTIKSQEIWNFTRDLILLQSESGRDILKGRKEWIKQEIQSFHIWYSD